MISQKIILVYGKLTNVFFLSKILASFSKWMLFVAIFSVFGLMLFLFLPNNCSECVDYSRDCSENYREIVSIGEAYSCDKITTLVHRWEYDNFCKEQCKLDIAVKNRNPEQCENIQKLKDGTKVLPSLRDSCFTLIAQTLRKDNLCKRAESVWAQNECVKSLQ